MNRKKIVAGNWKMNTTLPEGIKLISSIKKLLTYSSRQSASSSNDVVIIVAPPYTHLQKLVELTGPPPAPPEGGREPARIFVAAQNCSHEPKGAYTGEISAEMIRSAGAEYVIIGHSERRAYFKEDDVILSKKVELAMANDLLPIYCCGETLAQRNAKNHFAVVGEQLKKGLLNLSASDFGKIIVAYEPVWAIGTGVTATPQQAQEMHVHIRSVIEDKYGEKTAENTSIIYGGSCNPANAGDLFANPDVDGGLIGGASLKAEEFIAIIIKLIS